MKKLLIVSGIAALLVSVGLSGCEDTHNNGFSEKDRFIGTWRTAAGYPSLIEFSKNGSCIYGAAGTWDLIDGKLVITIPSYNLNDTYIYAFSNNDKTLTTTFTSNNYTQEWTKQ